MPDGLSYLSLKCVLEHLEASKRIHIASRSPGLQRFEKSIPLRLNRLAFTDFDIFLNDSYYSIGLRRSPNELSEEERRISKLVKRSFPRINNIEGVLLSYKEIHTNELQFSWNFEDPKEAPEGFKIKTRKLYCYSPELEIFRVSQFQKVLSYIHSHPLEEVRLNSYNDAILSQDIVKTAECLTIDGQLLLSRPLEIARRSRNKKLRIYGPWTQTVQDSIETIIRLWIGDQKEIGSSLEIECDPRLISNYLFHVWSTFDSCRQYLFYTETNRFFTGISIPLNSKSELNIFEGATKDRKPKNIIRMEVMPIEGSRKVPLLTLSTWIGFSCISLVFFFW